MDKYASDCFVCHSDGTLISRVLGVDALPDASTCLYCLSSVISITISIVNSITIMQAVHWYFFPGTRTNNSYIQWLSCPLELLKINARVIKRLHLNARAEILVNQWVHSESMLCVSICFCEGLLNHKDQNLVHISITHYIGMWYMSKGSWHYKQFWIQPWLPFWEMKWKCGQLISNKGSSPMYLL